MTQIIECVPNFSEGRSAEIIESIASSIRSVKECKLIDIDAGSSTNRTVYTIVGPPRHVLQAALAAARTAFKLIDMTKHKGEHPRLGAMDVCPFIPVRNVSMQDCVDYAHQFGKILAQDLNVPVYLYGEASNRNYRKTIPQIRQGEYESLKEKVLLDGWEPDFGPKEFIPNWGATIVGARKFLIAYNINILSTKEQAHRIALDIREQGRGDGKEGKLKSVQAMGWTLKEENLCQISTNITDYELTSIHTVYEECSSIAKGLNLPITGSQIVGVVPLNAILQVSEFYIQKDNLLVLEEDQKIRLAIDRLGLNSLGLFKPSEKIIEYMIDESIGNSLMRLSVKDFLGMVANRNPAPGGGSVSALIASLGSSLSMMTCWLSYGNRKFEQHDSKMRSILSSIHPIYSKLSSYVDEDAKAFDDYMEAMNMSNKSKESNIERTERIEKCLENAAKVPLSLQRLANQLWPSLKELAQIANINCISDLQVGVKSIVTGVWGANKNVLINVNQLKCAETAKQILEASNLELILAEDSMKEVLQIIDQRIQT